MGDSYRNFILKNDHTDLQEEKKFAHIFLGEIGPYFIGRSKSLITFSSHIISGESGNDSGAA
jgi:hypothetical protein